MPKEYIFLRIMGLKDLNFQGAIISKEKKSQNPKILRIKNN
jgi:hypothetical protein